jgi:hypothetical protein
VVGSVLDVLDSTAPVVLPFADHIASLLSWLCSLLVTPLSKWSMFLASLTFGFSVAS